MNKKFIKISLIICIPFILIIGFYMMTISDIENFESLPEQISFEYKGYEEDKYDHIITMVLKNGTKDIATINDMELSFNYKWDYKEDEENWSSDGDFYFRGYEEDIHSEERVYGIDPGTEKEVIFRMPKVLNLDEKVFDLEKPVVHYNISLYKFRTSKSSLMFGAGGMGGSRTLGMEY